MPFVAVDRTVPLSVLQDKYGLQAAGLAPTPAPKAKSSSSSSSKDLKRSKSGRFSLSRVLSRKSSSSSSSSTELTSEASSDTTSTPRLSSSSETTLAPTPAFSSSSHTSSKAKDFQPESAFVHLSDTYGFGGGVVAVPVLPKTRSSQTTPTLASAASSGTKKEKRSWKKDEGALEARYAWAAHRA